MKKIRGWYRSFKSRLTVDNIVDTFVDILLIVFDVLSSPILIVMRIIRFTFNKYFVDRIKRFARWITHKAIDPKITESPATDTNPKGRSRKKKAKPIKKKHGSG